MLNMFKVYNKDTSRSGVFIVNFEPAELEPLNTLLKIISYCKSACLRFLCQLNSVNGLPEIYRKFLKKLNF